MIERTLRFRGVVATLKSITLGLERRFRLRNDNAMLKRGGKARRDSVRV